MTSGNGERRWFGIVSCISYAKLTCKVLTPAICCTTCTETACVRVTCREGHIGVTTKDGLCAGFVIVEAVSKLP